MSDTITVFPGLIYAGKLDSPAERVAGKRHLRKGQILNVLRECDKSRVEIARELGFNLRSVSLLIDELIRDKLVCEHEGRKTSSGRRPIPVSLNSSAACVLGVDAGRKFTVAKLTDLQGRVIASTSRPSSFGARSPQQVAFITSFIGDFLKSYGRALPPLAGVGLAAEGMVYKQGVQKEYVVVAEPLRMAIEKQLQVPVRVDGDSRYTALGEQWFGQAKGLRDVAVLNITDGLGMACILNGTLVEGKHGWAGEIGHIPFGDPGIPCFCGSKSCLENVASGSGIERLAVAAKMKGNPTVLELAEMARNGSVPAQKLFIRFSHGLAIAVTLIMDLFNPEAVVLAGQLSSIADVYQPALTSDLETMVVPRIYQKTRLLTSKLGEDAVTLGACARVLHQIFETAHLSVEDVL